MKQKELLNIMQASYSLITLRLSVALFVTMITAGIVAKSSTDSQMLKTSHTVRKTQK